MNKMMKLLASASMVAGAAFAAAPAFAGGTTAGTSVLNTVTVKYKVNNVNQTDEKGSNEFLVDRKVLFSVTEATPSGAFDVKPGQANAYLTFDVLNSSNAPIDVKLTATELTTGTATGGLTGKHATFGLDAFGVKDGAYKLYIDKTGSGTVGSWDAGDTEITATTKFLDSVGIDSTVRVFIVATMPDNGVTNSQLAGFNLLGTAAEVPYVAAVRDANGVITTPVSWTANNTLGADIVASAAGSNTMTGMQTIWGATGFTGTDQDRDAFKMKMAALAVTKSSKVLYDPVNNTTNPFAIPGAVVEYCIAVTNTGSEEATGIDISDVLPAETAFYTGTPAIASLPGGVQVGGADCNTPGATAGTYAANTAALDDDTVSATNMTLAAPVAPATEVKKTVIFRTIIR